ncbi:MAG: hypothetical protein IPN34_15985 [Planctomycetes bacterium]|nr:hypothetical protein [Planctomycetota bacterium]
MLVITCQGRLQELERTIEQSDPAINIRSRLRGIALPFRQSFAYLQEQNRILLKTSEDLDVQREASSFGETMQVHEWH